MFAYWDRLMFRSASQVIILMICLKLKPKLELYSSCKGLPEALCSLLIDLGLFSALTWLVELVSEVAIFPGACSTLARGTGKGSASRIECKYF